MTMRRVMAAAVFAVLVTSAPASAQITPNKTWAFRELLSSADLNSVLADLGSTALSRLGGAMQDTLTTRDVVPDATATRSLGTGVTRYATGFFSGAVTAGTSTFNTNTAVGGTLTVADTTASALDVAGGITAGTGNVGIVDATGKIPALSSVFLANLSGANLTGLLEANIADGTVFPRLAGTETITGIYTFDRTAPVLAFNESDGAVDNRLWRFVVDGEALNLQATNDAQSSATNFLVVNRTGITVDSVAVTANALTTSGTFSVAGSATVSGPAILAETVRLTNVISPAQLTADQNDYAPTGHATASVIRLSVDGSTRSITGLAGGVAGRVVHFIHTGVSGGSNILFMEDSASSTAANRILVGSPGGGSFTLFAGASLSLFYDGTSSRWRRIH